ncbi:MAG: Mu-like prophage I protein [Rhodobacteraceae bacterium HLUCCA12]|jgi:phage I-like protein|nr:MAG: Mu-like prophage I protein [Rhodobacteraceae bacterium HLUCCA12]
MPAIGLDLALNTETGVPGWVQLLPPGAKIAGNDGRTWSLPDPGAVLRAFNAAGVDLAIDYEHQQDDAARRAGNGPVPAAGWIKELRHDPARGLLGRVEWTANARRMIEGLEYRYLSPVFMHTKAGQITRLLGASLVHRPNLQLKALAREETEPMTITALSKIATALGLEQTADEGAILTAINAMQAAPDPARFVPIEAVQELMQERALSKATASEEVAVARVEAAMNDGYLTPGMRDWAVSLCRADPASFDAFVQSATPAFGHLFQKSARLSLNSERQSAGHRPKSAEEAAVFAQLGLDQDGAS